ncbi:TetR/AcrR family transcriptional regulator [Neptunomonas phycophila]|uniref:TetR/AcrR family transcriptional regulator n=1 Tax=Neptunomonas phycophila TaxID=1572645 RepID=UPI000948DBF9|nr:TetR/AcrR family transcriptional regulator [Neptunomonas phycophila]
MNQPERRPVRGRPPSITHQKIVNAGIKIGLPNLTFVGVAAALGVSHMALYKHVDNLEALKSMVAEEIFTRWDIPKPNADQCEDFETYLVTFSASIRLFVKAHPGLTPFVIRRMAATEPMLDKIKAHQVLIADRFSLTEVQARWVLATVAFHCIAVSDTVYSVLGSNPEPKVVYTEDEAEMEAELIQGMHALVTGVLVMLEDGRYLNIKPSHYDLNC